MVDRGELPVGDGWGQGRMKGYQGETLRRDTTLQGTLLRFGLTSVARARVEDRSTDLLWLQRLRRDLDWLWSFLWGSSFNKSLIESWSNISSLFCTGNPLLALGLIWLACLYDLDWLITIQLRLYILSFGTQIDRDYLSLIKKALTLILLQDSALLWSPLWYHSEWYLFSAINRGYWSVISPCRNKALRLLVRGSHGAPKVKRWLSFYFQVMLVVLA